MMKLHARHAILWAHTASVTGGSFGSTTLGGGDLGGGAVAGREAAHGVMEEGGEAKLLDQLLGPNCRRQGF